MNFSKSVLAAVAMGALALPAHAAGLNGDTVGTRHFGDWGDTGVNSDVVGTGEEGNFDGHLFYDYGDLSFSIRSDDAYCGIFACSGAVALELTSLDLDGGIGGITGVTITTSLTGLSVMYTTDSITFSWAEQTLPVGMYIGATINGGPINPVPEPETYAMLLAGLGLLGVVARRRKSQAAA